MTAIRIIDDHLELANIGTNSHAQIDTHIAAADNYVKRDGSLALTSDWDIGNGRKILADEIRARDGAGLKLYDDGGHGVFVKDGGSLELDETTSADTGVIYKGADRFIHNYAPSGSEGRNTFIGVQAGNFTMAISGGTWNASNNVGIGFHSLNSITTGNNNMGNGTYTLVNNTTGVNNSAIGYGTLFSNLSGNYNMAIGSYALRYTQTGSKNTAVGSEAGKGVSGNSFSNNTLIGYRAGYALQNNANNNILLGYHAGDSITTGTDNIIIGYDEDTPAAGTNHHLNIGGLIYGDLSGGTVGIGTATQTAKLDINSDILRLRTAKTPATAGAAGNTGDMCADANYFYRCVSTNSWKRAALNVW